MKYKICTANSAIQLDTFVNRDIANGWVPQGGVAVSQSSQNVNFLRIEDAYDDDETPSDKPISPTHVWAQAMIKNA